MTLLTAPGRKTAITVLGGISLYLVLTVPFLHGMPVTTDEVQFAEPAYNFIKFGHFGTTSLTGLYNFQYRTYWQHPLYLMLMYFPIRVFGFSSWSIKILSVAIGLAALFGAYRIGRKLGVPYLFPAMMTLNVLFIFLAKIGRMEILTLCLSLGTLYYALDKRYFAAGIASSLALLTHPTGIFTVINALIVFWYHRRIESRYFLGLALPVGLAFIFILGDLKEFWRQYFHVQKYLYNARDLFGGPYIQAENFVSLIKRASTWLKWQVPVAALFLWGIPQNNKDMVQKAALAILAVNLAGLVLVVPNKYINYYTALLLPYFLLFTALAVSRRRSVPVITVLIVGLVLNGLVGIKAAASFGQNKNDMLKIQLLVEPGSTVLGPVTLGAAIDDHRVVGFHVVRMIMDLEKKTVDEALKELNPDYIIIDSSVTGEQSWRLFTLSEEGLAEFLKKNTVFCGQAQFNGDEIFIFRYMKN